MAFSNKRLLFLFSWERGFSMGSSVTECTWAINVRGGSRIFQGGLRDNSYIIYKNYIYIAIIHIIILINKVHVSTYRAWSYSLHTAVPAAAMH